AAVEIEFRLDGCECGELVSQRVMAAGLLRSPAWLQAKSEEPCTKAGRERLARGGKSRAVLVEEALEHWQRDRDSGTTDYSTQHATSTEVVACSHSGLLNVNAG